MKFATSIFAILAMSSFPDNIAHANWFARCPCSVDGLGARNKCFDKCGPTVTNAPRLLSLSTSNCIANATNLYERKEGDGPLGLEAIPPQPDGFPPVEKKSP